MRAPWYEAQGSARDILAVRLVPRPAPTLDMERRLSHGTRACGRIDGILPEPSSLRPTRMPYCKLPPERTCEYLDELRLASAQRTMEAESATCFHTGDLSIRLAIRASFRALLEGVTASSGRWIGRWEARDPRGDDGGAAEDSTLVGDSREENFDQGVASRRSLVHNAVLRRAIRSKKCCVIKELEWEFKSRFPLQNSSETLVGVFAQSIRGWKA